MIKASELRIGNYYKAPIEITGSIEAKINFNKERIFALSLGSMVLLYEFNLLDLLKPIPLTEEWLKKLGFEKDGEVPKIIIIDDYQIYPNAKVAYVHQIQNLYFALTGEELKAKS